MKPRDSKVEAKQHWNEVRGGIKYRLASQQYESGAFEDCIGTASEVIALDPGNVSAYALLTRAQLERSRFASAQQTLGAARLAGLESADLDYLQGVLFEQADRVDEAVAEYQRALKKNPSHGDAFLATVECLVSMDRPNDALAVIREHAERFDDEAMMAVVEARVQELLGDTQRATSLLAGAVVSTQGDAKVAEELTQLLLRQNRCAEAVALMEPLLRPRKSSGEIPSSLLVGLAACELTLDDPASARRLLADYTVNHRDDAPAQLLLAKAALAVGDFTAARSAVEAAHEREPNQPEIQFVYAIVEWKQGHIDLAEQLVSRIIGRMPFDADVHCLMGEIQLAKDRRVMAGDYFAKAREIDPASEWAKRGAEVCKRDSRAEVLPTP